MGIATDLIIVVIVGLLGGLAARKLNQPLILGYILAGIAVGPFTGGVTVSDVDEIEQLAEIGVALLLFSLGLEFSLKSLKPIRAIALGGSALQVLLTLLVGFALGRYLGWETTPSLWFSVAIASSSTAVIAKTLASRGQMGTLSSRVMLGMSIVQDILVIPLMVIMMSLESSGVSLVGVLKPLIKVILFVAAMLYAGARIIPHLMERVARWESRELFVLAVTATGLGVGYLTYSLDLSFAFGAFIAGLVLSESDYGRAALNDLVPVRDLFGLLFFVTIGMLFDPSFLVARWRTIAALLAAVTLARGTILAGTGRLFGYRNVIPLALFLGMIPLSEIAFIVLQRGLDSGAIPYDIYALALNVVILSMLLGPLATGLTGPAYGLVKRLKKPDAIRTVNLPPTGLADHVVIAGGGTFGRHIGFVLRSLEHPYLIIEPHHATFLKGQEEGLSLLFGDPGQDAIVEAAGIERARLLVITLRGRLETLDVFRAARKRNGTIPVMARAESREDRRLLEERGVTRVIDPEMEAGLEMARQALLQLDVPATVVHREIETLRRAGQADPFDGRPEHEALSRLRRATERIQLEWIYLHEGNPLVGKRLSETPIRSGFGLSVVAVGRDENAFPDVTGSLVLRAGDYVAVVGTQEQNRRFVEAFGTKRARSEP
ncbi:cation:proton antiporter [Aminithiophilus ramosus]|uniref:Cation:proton antiporter n=2 Tax=Synergistales TaxID=649776 RepID=A0A9Q7A6F1_9BACT|nr:cation:proton antiporter [Aminithiophilus ramosus]QTX31801.1 cation:proton antiporter [Aminithiophilus ramosus]QVL35624.1 cation:proton antiporter [Synergistota bacterium]